MLVMIKERIYFSIPLNQYNDLPILVALVRELRDIFMAETQKSMLPSLIIYEESFERYA